LGVNQTQHVNAAAQLLVGQLVAKLNRNLWAGPPGPVLAAFNSLLKDDDQIRAALVGTLARFDIHPLQMRTLNTHIYTGKDLRGVWKVESGPAVFVDSLDRRTLKYHFASSDDPPVVLRCDFTLPPNVSAADLHKLMFSFQADNSWHHVDAALDMGDEHWVSTRSEYIAQYRTQSIIYQPPTFDDTNGRPCDWISLRHDGAAPGSLAPGRAVLRITIHPSSTARAIFGKCLRNYIRAFNSVPFWNFLINSVLLVVLEMFGALFSAAWVAYAFARLNWPGRGLAFMALLATMMLPGQVTMIPSFMIWKAVGWYNTLNPLWVPAWFGTAFFIFLMIQQMKTIPRELEEAARIDGLNAVQTWYYVILPQVKPALAAIAIMTFMGAWNDFMGPLIYLRDQAKFPLSLGLFSIRVDTVNDWTMIMAGNMLMTLPVIIIFFLFQRYFIEGMTMTGVKG
jgi:ABC-type glycerol-3-phosphate transport system permease component